MLVPVVELREPPLRPSVREQRARLARTLYAQCCSAGTTQTILVIGASPTSGAGVVSSLLETAAAEAGSVQLVTLNPEQVDIPGLARTDSRQTLIINAGAVGASPLMPEAVERATTVVLTARLEADTMAQVRTVCAATEFSSARRLAAVTYRPWWPSWFAQRVKPHGRRGAGRTGTKVDHEGDGAHDQA